ncbi:MAG TPA: cytochrome c oxidase subunit II [Rhabdaerophilum sp.]|nr:cytochrome c oxidase subunit II [Rhabdaerophilum sp.]
MALTSINIAGVLGTAKHRLLATAGLVGLLGSGTAQAGEGLAQPWQLGLQDAATPVAEFIHSFHDWLLVTITVITLFVLALLVIIVAKFNAKANPVPSKTTHHVGLEIAWTLIPVLILVVIAIPSFRLLKQQLVTPPADLTIKLTGNAWYWKFEYPKDAGGGFEFDVRMMTEADIAEAVKAGKGKKEDYHRLLSVDNEAVVPVNKNIVVQVTSADVLHAFAVQPFGVKVDAVPGRLNQTWFRATKEGVYYGQCQELCGKDHAFMPLAIRVVSEEKYKAWLADAKKKFASTDPAVRTADNTVSSR